MFKQDYLYFPECKIIKAQLVPKSTAVISFYIKATKNTPKHFPIHPLLEGKIETTFGLELTPLFQETKNSNFFNVFNCPLTSSPSRLVGLKVSILVLFTPDGDKKMDTIGLGLPNDLITIYNDFWDPKEIQVISQSSKLFAELPNKGKIKAKKI